MITYQVNKGVSINDVNINWGTDREMVRNLLSENYVTQDQVIDLSEYNNGSDEFNIYQKRDVYKINDKINIFYMLNYDKKNKLRDIEVHNTDIIRIGDIYFSFDDSIVNVLEKIKTLSPNVRKLRDKSYFFENLKIVIADKRSLGGITNKLGYFYASSNVEHLKTE